MTLLSAVTLLLVHGFGPSLKPCATPLASSGIAACAAGITPGILCTATVVSQQINSPIEEEKRGKKKEIQNHIEHTYVPLTKADTNAVLVT